MGKQKGRYKQCFNYDYIKNSKKNGIDIYADNKPEAYQGVLG